MNTGETPPQKSDINTGSTEDLVVVSQVHLMNLPQEVITTTEDKVRLCLSEHLKRMEQKRGWVTPLGILVALIATLMTTNFKDAGLDAATWKAIFIIATGLSFGWLIYSVIKALRSEKIEDIIGELKKHSDSLIKFVKK